MENVLPLLALLACPIGMGAMMWMMMGRGGKSREEQEARPASIEVLREEHRRLGAEIERLEGREPVAVRNDPDR